MERLRLERGFFRTPPGDAVYLIGANYWPQLHGPWMYGDPWDDAEVSREFAQLAALGCNVVRVFCFTPDFLVAPDAVNGAAADRLEQLVELAAAQNLWSMPTFLVGHMSGENWQPAWSQGRNWYTDEVVLKACELLVRTLVTRFKDNPAVAAWLMTNEWPLFAGNVAAPDATHWAKRLCAAVRAADPERAVSLGDGAWDIIAGQPAAVTAAALGGIVDFFGPHFYPKETDAIRHSVFAPFAMRMTQTFQKPVLLEEFGCSSDQANDSYAADYYRTVLWSSFGAGNCGALFWNSHDFPLTNRPPYSHHPYELHFGVIRVDGTFKPQAHEVERFARYALKNNPDEWQPETPLAAIARSAYYFESFPFDWGWTKPQMRDLLLQAYACAVMGGVNARYVDLTEDIPADIRLLFAPCLQQVTTGDVEHLERYVSQGGAVYLSHGGEPWFPELAGFIGATPEIRYGLVEPPHHDPRLKNALSLRFVSDFATITKGTIVQIPLNTIDRRSAALACTPVDATVLAVDETGMPALFERQLGEGRVIFMAYPLEYLALHGLETNARNGAWKIYNALAHECGALAPTRALHPLVQSFGWRSLAEEWLGRLLLVNHGWSDVTTELSGEVQTATDLEQSATVDPRNLSLPAKGVIMLEYTL